MTNNYDFYFNAFRVGDVKESVKENSDSESTDDDNLIARITRKPKKPTKSNGVGRSNIALAVVSR